jgi:hypothetical protein
MLGRIRAASQVINPSTKYRSLFMGNIFSRKARKTAEKELSERYKSYVREQRASFSSASPGGSVQYGEKITMISFNMLAPCYKRLAKKSAAGPRLRESSDDVLWNERAQKALNFFETEIFSNKTSIIALQEFWLEPAYVKLFEPVLEKHGYELKYLKRMGSSKTDSVVLCVRKEDFEILDSKEVQLIPNGDRVALLLLLKQQGTDTRVIVANTHLSFPHNALDSILQQKQVEALTHAMQQFCDSTNEADKAEKQEKEEEEAKEGGGADSSSSSSSSIIHRFILGDFNQPLDSPVCDHLRAEGYVSTFEISPPRVTANSSCSGGNNADEIRFNSDTKDYDSDSSSNAGTGAAAVNPKDDFLHMKNLASGGGGSSSGVGSDKSSSGTTSNGGEERTASQADSSSVSVDGGSVGRGISRDTRASQDDGADDSEHGKGEGSGDGSGDGSGGDGEEEEDVGAWVSHRTHRLEDVGVDHIFFYNHHYPQQQQQQLLRSKEQVEEEGRPRAGWQGGSILIGNCRVLPDDVACDYWDGSFEISDHRPISSEVFLSR